MFPLRKKTPAAFTLLEVCLAVFIAVLIVLAAVPSLGGVIEEQRAKRVFNQFDDLVRQAQTRSVTERRPYAIVWDLTGIFLAPLNPQSPEEEQGSGRIEFGLKQTPELQLPAALTGDAPKVWTFWPTGTCEPATVICRTAGSPWSATYDPLTVQPAFTSP